jgi:hypothetical protein
MKLLYIAGPFRGPTPLDVRRNVERARDLGLEVAKCGAYPVIPHTMTSEFDKQLTDEFWLEGTLRLMLRCHGIILTPDWEHSTGAREERRVAQAYAGDYLRIFYANDPTWRLQVAEWAAPEIV